MSEIYTGSVISSGRQWILRKSAVHSAAEGK